MRKKIRRILNGLIRCVIDQVERTHGVCLNSESSAQKALMLQYRLLAQNGLQSLPAFQDVGFRKYSQFEEDGILIYIFSLIKPFNRTCVEICAGNGRECNTTNLIVNHGWWGHLFDGDARNVKDGRAFFKKNKDTFAYPPRFTHAWITAENVNGYIKDSGARGVVDLLSIDLDGMDYWVWNAISVIEPRVVVCEIHNIIPVGEALTVPYDPGFVFKSADYRGASLAAMCKLARKKGYRLVGMHRLGFNAFFIKEGVGEAYFPEVAYTDLLQDPFSKSVRDARWSYVKHLDWQEV